MSCGSALDSQLFQTDDGSWAGDGSASRNGPRVEQSYTRGKVSREAVGARQRVPGLRGGCMTYPVQSGDWKTDAEENNSRPRVRVAGCVTLAGRMQDCSNGEGRGGGDDGARSRGTGGG